MGYVPSGFTPEQWRRKQEEEKAKEKGKKYGATGPQSFKSRSLQSFQTDLEKGKAEHLMPVMFAKDRVKKGELRPEDVPYMQRGGSWDNTDVKGAKKRKWNEIDKKYEDQASASSQKIDWTGKQTRRGPTQVNKKSENKPETKKLFGLW